MFVIASLVATAGNATTSSFAVTASAAAVKNGMGKLAAWIGFNQSGSWEANEQIFNTIDLAAGLNILSFTVAVGAKPGETAARFRISSASGLAPTGAASDGEVEDYIATILDGDDAGEAAVQIDAPAAGTIEVVTGSSTVIVRTRDPDNAIFVAPGGAVSTLNIRGTDGDDTLSLEDVPSVDNSGDALGGNDLLNLLGGGFALDLTTIPDNSIQGIETINITGNGDNTLTLDVNEVVNISPTSDTLRVKSGAGDTVHIGTGWKFANTLVENGDFVRVLTQGDATLQLDGPFNWSYPENPLDINGNGSVEALDTLIIINELNDPQFSAPTTGALLDPTTLTEFPNFFYDASPNGFVVALYALVVINFLNNPNGMGEGEAANGHRVAAQVVAAPSVTVPSAEHGHHVVAALGSTSSSVRLAANRTDNTIAPADWQRNQSATADDNTARRRRDERFIASVDELFGDLE